MMNKTKTKTKKKTNTQKIASVYNNPGFKYWAVPPKKGPLSQGLKLKPKQVKKVQENIYGRNRQSSP